MPRILIFEDDIGHFKHRPHIFPYPSPPLTLRRSTRRRAQPSGIDSRLSALPVCPKMRLGEQTMPGCRAESGSPRTNRRSDAGGQKPPAGGQLEETDAPRACPDAQVLRAGGPLSHAPRGGTCTSVTLVSEALLIASTSSLMTSLANRGTAAAARPSRCRPDR